MAECMRGKAEEGLPCYDRGGLGEEVAQVWVDQVGGLKWVGA